jgi:hypothetical protein
MLHVLIGAIPITMLIEKNSLWAFYNITINKGFIEYEIARRQLALKDHHSHSWFTHIRKLLQKYNLPTAYDMMDYPPTKHQWKQLLNKAFEEHLHTEWHNDINDTPSLKYLVLPTHLNKQSHQLWHSVLNNIRAVTKALSRLNSSQSHTLCKQIGQNLTNTQFHQIASYANQTVMIGYI